MKERTSTARALRYADLLIDWTFKRVFGESSDKSFMISLLRSILGLEIRDITYLPNELVAGTPDGKNFSIDLRCLLSDGSTVHVEVQHYYQPDFKLRCMAYVSRDYMNQGTRGGDYFGFRPVYLIALISDEVSGGERLHSPEHDGKVIYNYAPVDAESGELLVNSINVIFVELGKFDKTEHECETTLDKWLYVLRNMRRLEKLPDEFRSQVFERLFEAVEMSKFTKEMMTAYELHELHEMDRMNILRGARMLGQEEGLAEGQAKARLDIAKALLSNGVTPELISSSTGLSLEEVCALAQ